MKKFITTLKNIYHIEELRQKILYTLGIILIFRVGSYIALPGIDVHALSLTQFTANSREGLLGLLDMFSGGAFSNASIFALGIMPYISASIVVQLLMLVVPYFQRLQKEGESGRKKINQITRFLTIFVTFIQAPAYITNLVKSPLPVSRWMFVWVKVRVVLSSLSPVSHRAVFCLRPKV